MDLFETWLNKERESKWIQRALTDKSYKDIYRKKYHEELPEDKVNFELATYGDAILKMCLMKIFIESNKSKPTEEKKRYESDKSLVKYIASRYDLIKFIHMNEEGKVKDYDYDKHYKIGNDGEIKGNHCKYIATCVEALIAAIYIEEKSIDPIIKLIQEWMLLCADQQ